MDYALLAATALGGIGLYLMLPRERAPLVRVGGLLAVMALAGFFLYLIRLAAMSTGTDVTAAGAPPVFFYLFAAIMIASAVGVICQPQPVYAALYFVLLTLAGAGVAVLLLAEFMAIVLIIIYAGAILVTYVFVIMLASQSAAGSQGDARASNYDRRAAEPFAAVLVSFLLLGTVLQVLFPTHGKTIATAATTPDRLMAASLEIPVLPTTGVNASEGGTVANVSAEVAADTTATTMPAAIPSNVQVLGASLYSHYELSLELAGILLTIALIGAVMIARKNTDIDPSAGLLGTGEIPTE